MTELGPAGVPDAVDVLCEAFREYPVMRHVLGTRGVEYDRELEVLIRFFATARRLRDEPILAIREDGRPVGCALVTLPERTAPDELGDLRERVWAELGSEARARYEAFGEVCARFATAEPHHHLNMIGVRRAHRGRGLAGRLLDHVHGIARDHPGSCGVSLTTEDPANLALYERAGYEIVGHARVDATLETWSLFRRDPPATG